MLKEKTEEAELRVHPIRYASVYVLAAVTLMDTFLLLFTTTLLAEQLQAGILIGFIVPAYTGMNAATELFWGWMADKYGRRIPLIIGSCFTVPACVMFAFATNPWHLIIASAIRGIGGSADVPISRAIVADLAPRKALGERMGAFQMARYAAPLIGITVAGPLFDMNWRLPFLAAAAFEFLDFLLIVFLVPETVTKRPMPRKAKVTKEVAVSPAATRAGEFFSGIIVVILNVLLLVVAGLGWVMFKPLDFVGVNPLFSMMFGGVLILSLFLSVVFSMGYAIPLILGPKRTDAAMVGAKNWSVILRRRGVALFVITVFVGSFVGRGISTLVYPLFQKEFGLSATQVSITYTIGMLVAIVGYTPGGRISDKIGRKFPIIFQGYYGALTNLLYTLIPAMASGGMAFPGFIILSIVGSASVIIGGPAFSAYFYEWVPLKERGRASAMTDFFDDIGVTFGFPLVAFIYEGIDPLTAFYFATVVGVITTTVIWIFWKPAPPSEDSVK